MSPNISANAPIAFPPTLRLFDVWNTDSTTHVEPRPDILSQINQLKRYHAIVSSWPDGAVITAWRAYSQYVHGEDWNPIPTDEADILFDAFLREVEITQAEAWGLSVNAEAIPTHEVLLSSLVKSSWYSTLLGQHSGLWVLVDTHGARESMGPDFMFALAQRVAADTGRPVYRIHDKPERRLRLIDTNLREQRSIPAEESATVRTEAHQALERASTFPGAILVFDAELMNHANAKAALAAVGNERKTVVARIAADCDASAYGYLSQLAGQILSADALRMFGQVALINSQTCEVILQSTL